jgi:hypothetical protein
MFIVYPRCKYDLRIFTMGNMRILITWKFYNSVIYYYINKNNKYNKK